MAPVRLALAMALEACSNSAEIRYEVTVEVDDNGTHRAGSSVMSFALSKPAVALVSPYDAKFRGEAVAVDLGNGRTLFALLKDEKGDGAAIQMLPERLFKDLSSGSERVRNIKDIAEHEGLVRDVPRFWPAISDSREPMVQYPMLVRFRSPEQPESIEAVAPDALDQAFGPGVRLKRITAKITDAPVTVGIKRRLPWLEEVGRARGTIIPNPPRLLKDSTPVQRVSPGDFTTELYR